MECYYYDKNGMKSEIAQKTKYFCVIWSDENTGRAYKNITTEGTLYYFDENGIGVLQEGYYAIKDKRVVKPDTKRNIILIQMECCRKIRLLVQKRMDIIMLMKQG